MRDADDWSIWRDLRFRYLRWKWRRMLEHQAAVRAAMQQAAKSAAVADQGVFLEVNWIEPAVAEAVHELDTLIGNISGQGLVDTWRIIDRLLDIRGLLTTERSPTP